MSCSCGSHDTEFLCAIRSTVNGVLTSLEATGVLPYASQPVELVYVTRVQPRPFAGDPGGTIINKVQIQPTPMSDTNIKFYQPDGSIVEKTGTAKLKNILAADTQGDIGYTSQQLQSADYWLIAGVQYDLVEGSLSKMANNIFWEAQLMKSKMNGI